MIVLRAPGVYRPQSDSSLLAQAVASEVRRSDVVLDVFTGTGFVAIAAARAGARRVDAVDVSRRAAACARLNARLNGLRVRARSGDLFEPLGDRRYDLVTANPPYVPSVDPQLVPRGAARAWEAGFDGRALLDRLIAAVPGVLRPGGRLLVVHGEACGFERTVANLEAAGLEATIAVRRTEPLGPLTSGRRETLVARGLLDPDQREEDVAVIWARLPAGADPAQEGDGAVGGAVGAATVDVLGPRE